METWGSLPKDQIDPETIEEAIARLIQAHDDDENAHLETGQSLQSHKASEIIDHLAESVLNDKLQPEARAFVAIVDQNGAGDYTDIQEAIDYAYSVGGGLVYIKGGRYLLTSDIQLRPFVSLVGDGIQQTILDFQGGAYGFKFAISDQLEGSSNYDAVITNGSKVVTFPSGIADIRDYLRVGMWFYTEDYEDDKYVIESIDSDTQITLTTTWANPTDTYTANHFAFHVTFDHTSKVLTFPTGTNLITSHIKNYYYVSSSVAGLSYPIASIDSETQLTLIDYPDPDDDGEQICEVLCDRFASVKISSLQVRDSDASILFDGSNGGITVDLEDVYAYICLDFYYTTSIVDTVNLSNVIVDECSCTDFIRARKVTASDCLFNVNNTCDYYFKACSDCNVYNSRIIGASNTQIYLFDSLLGTANFVSCSIEFLGDFNETLYSQSVLNLSNCQILYNRTANMVFTAKNSRVAGCRFEMGSTYNFVLSASSEHCIVSGNVFTNEITDSGTGNLVTGNIINTI